MPIGPDEVEIIGSWVMVNGRLTEDDAGRRIISLIETELQHVATTPDGWENSISTREIDDSGSSRILVEKCKAVVHKRCSLLIRGRPKRSTESQ